MKTCKLEIQTVTKHETAYRSDIDGLRAIAVLAVLFFHYGATWLPGGFAGVDVFFVISGYLITRHLSADISENGFSLGPLLVRFYNKRIRRIIPALAVVLAATIAAGWFLLMPGDFASTGKSAAYSAFGLGNLYFYWNTGYFDREAELQPLLHMWSLGVEEQFYLVWPVLLALIMWVARGRRIIIGAVITVLIVAGLAFSMQTVAVDPKAAFFLPLPRAWELGIGGLLAFLPAMRSRWVSEATGIVGISLVAWPLFMLAGAESSLGLSMLPAVIGSALLIWPRTESVASRLLSIRPMRAIGLISYSLYLWHWPIIVLFRHYNNGVMPTLLEAVVLAIISMALAYISWRFIEGPARRMQAPSWSAIATGLTTAAFVAFAGQSVAQNGGFANRLPPDAQKMASLEVMWQWDCPQQVEVPELGGNFCAFGAPWETAKVRGILWGDSHAEHFAPIVEAAIGDRSVSVLLYRMCPAALGGAVRRIWAEEPNYVKFCSSSRQRAASWLTTADIQLVLLSASWQSLTAYVSQDGTLPDAMTMADLVKEGTSDLM